MSKLTELRNKIDDQEDRIDDWLMKRVLRPHTARIAIGIALGLVIAGLALWLL